MSLYLNDRVVHTKRPELGVGVIEKRWPWGFAVQFPDETVMTSEAELQKAPRKVKAKVVVQPQPEIPASYYNSMTVGDYRRVLAQQVSQDDSRTSCACCGHRVRNDAKSINKYM